MSLFLQPVHLTLTKNPLPTCHQLFHHNNSMLPSLNTWSNFRLKNPTTPGLRCHVPICICNIIRVQFGIIPASGHANPSVNYKVSHVHSLGPQVPRKGLRQQTLRSLLRSESRSDRFPSHAGSRSGDQDRSRRCRPCLVRSFGASGRGCVIDQSTDKSQEVAYCIVPIGLLAVGRNKIVC